MAKNKEILLLVGIPASGKSTWAKEFLEKNDKWIRISRDDYRLMLVNSQTMDYKGESLVTELVNNALVSAINMKYNVILDQTNVSMKYLEDTINFCNKLADVNFRIFDISLDKAIERDAERTMSVGDTVIKRMFTDYKNLVDSGINIYNSRPKLPRIVNNLEWEPYEDFKQPAVIFDLDGTLAHANDKRGYYDWKRVDMDDVDSKIKTILRLFHTATDYKILIVTGRDAASEKSTIKWLDENNIPFDALYMRPKDDRRKDTVVKSELYDQHIKDGYNILCVFDDREGVVEMWRSLGLKCLQVMEGKY